MVPVGTGLVCNELFVAICGLFSSFGSTGSSLSGSKFLILMGFKIVAV